MSIGRKVKIQLKNPKGKFCWFNSSVYATLHVTNECEITIPETPADIERQTLTSQLKIWHTLDHPEVLSPFDAIRLFVEELLPNTTEIYVIREQTQEVQLFFQAVAGEEKFGSKGLGFLSFMRPSALTQVEFDKCSECLEMPGK